MAHDAFICYSRADIETVEAVCNALEDNGFGCWYAPRNVPAGTDWDDSIIEALGASRVVVLVWSSRSDQSRHVKREVALALDEMDVTVIPFRIESIEPSKLRYYLSSIQWLDASTSELEANLKRLVERVRIAIPIAGQILATPAEQIQRSRPPSIDTTWAHVHLPGAREEQLSQREEPQMQIDEETRLLREAEAIQQAEAVALEKAEAEAFRHAQAKAFLRAELEALQHCDIKTSEQVGAKALRQAREDALKRLETEAIQHAEAKARLLAEVESLRLAAQSSLKRAGAGHDRQ